MSFPGYSVRWSAGDSEPAPTVSGSASPERTCFAPSQDKVHSKTMVYNGLLMLRRFLPMGKECVYSDGHQNGSCG